MLPDGFVRPWVRTGLWLDGTRVDRAGPTYWVQAPLLFVDVRAPGGPGDDTAFAGTTSFDGGWLTWRHAVQRALDLSTDRAEVVLDGHTLIEDGIDLFGAERYRESWRALDGRGPCEQRADPGLVAVRNGDHAAAVLDRRREGGGFAARYWQRRAGRWEVVLTIGTEDVPTPDGGLFDQGATSAPSRNRGSHRLTDVVRDAIVVGRFAPGERLTEERLAAELGVSRSPVREVLRSLATEGFVRSGHYAGTFVADLGDDEVEDLLAVRAAIETLVARRAAVRRAPDHVLELRTTVAQAQLAIVDDRHDDLVELNSRFHATLAAASGNPTLRQLLDQLRAMIAWVYAADVKERAAASWREHEALVDAVTARDGDAAATAAHRHVSEATAAYRRHPWREPAPTEIP
jgi:DNA-binding GntR family transcriptional regulator